MPANPQIPSATSAGSNNATTPDDTAGTVQSLLNLPAVSLSGVPTSTAPVKFNQLASVTSSGGTGTSTVLGSPGGVPITLTAGVLGSATAGVSHSSVQGSAGFNANTALSLTTASGVSVALQANAGVQASATATVNSNGVHVQGAVGASATASLTAANSTGLGSAGNISSNGAVTVGIVAVAAGNATLGSTGVAVSGQAFSGSVAAATAGSTYTGEGVTAGAGAGIYSPGSFGAGTSASALNADGYVGISAGLVLDVGLGGVALNFQFGIDTQDLQKDLGSALGATASAFSQFGAGLAPATHDPNPVVSGLASAILNTGADATAAYNATAGALTTVANTISNGVTSAVSTLSNGVNQAINAAGGAFTTVENAINSTANQAINYVQQYI